MATGGGGTPKQIASAYVRLWVDDRDYHASMRRATAALNAFRSAGIRANRGLNFRRMASQVNSVIRAISSLERSLSRASRGATSLRSVLSSLRTPRLGGLGGLGSRSFALSITSPFKTAGSIFKKTILDPARVVFGQLNRFIRMSGLVGVIGGAFSIAKMTQTAARFESQVTTLRRVSDTLNSRQFGGAVGGLKALAARSPGVSLDSIMGVATMGAKMGLPGNQLRLFTNDLTKLGAVLDESDLPLEEATERIGSLLSIFDIGAQNAVRLGSALVRLDNVSVASARDILDVANRFAASAAIFGMTPQQTLALATAMKQAKIPTETAGTNMQQILMRMARTETAPQFAKLAGMSTRGFLGTLQSDPMKAITSTARGIAGMGPIEANRALDKLRLDGQRARSVMLSLARVIDLIPEYTKAANEEWDRMGTVMEGFNRQANTFNAQWTLMKNNMSLMAIEMGRALLPAAKGLATAIRRLTESFSEMLKSGDLEAWGEKIKTSFEMVATMATNSSDWWKLIRLSLEDEVVKMAKVFSNFVTSIPAMITSQAPKIALALGNVLKKSIMGVAEMVGGGAIGTKNAFGIDLHSFDKGIAQIMEWMGVIPKGSSQQVNDVIEKSKKFGLPKWMTDEAEKANPFDFGDIFKGVGPGKNEKEISEIKQKLLGVKKGSDLKDFYVNLFADTGDKIERWMADRREQAAKSATATPMSARERAVARSRALRARRWGGLDNEPSAPTMSPADRERSMLRRILSEGPNGPTRRAMTMIEERRRRDDERARAGEREVLRIRMASGRPVFGPGARARVPVPGSGMAALAGKIGLGAVGPMAAMMGGMGPLGALGAIGAATGADGERVKSATPGGIGFGSRAGSYQRAAALANLSYRAQRNAFNRMMAGGAGFRGPQMPAPKPQKKTLDDVVGVLEAIKNALIGNKADPKPNQVAGGRAPIGVLTA